MRQKEAGFTLVEMLVSLAIMGMAAVILTAGIEQIGLGTQVANRTEDQFDAVASAQILLRQRLTMIQPVADARVIGGGTLDFSGQAQSVDFIGPVANRGAPDALQHYRLQRDPDGDLVLLSLNTLDPRVDPHRQQSQGWTPLTLLSGCSQLAVRYFGQDRLMADRHAVWQASWSSRASLPMLVQISVNFADGDRRRWPDLVVHPQAATRDPCPRDVVTGGCAMSGNAIVPVDQAT